MSIDNLRKYVSEACPEVNQLLRANKDASEYTFDSLFEEGIVQQPLYRFVDNEMANIQGDIFTDKGYLSCTSNFDSFIGHVSGDEVACLQFDIQDHLGRIDVCALLPEYNNEHEIILPRGLEFMVKRYKKYSTYKEIQEFLDMIQSVSSAKEIIDILNIKAIHFYRLSLPGIDN